MPDLANLSLSSLALTQCPSLKPPSPDSATESSSHMDSLVKTLALTNGDHRSWDQRSGFGILHEDEEVCIDGNASEVKVTRTNGSSPEDHVTAWVQKKSESGVSQSWLLPFLFGAKKMVECLVCHKFIYPGEELLCTVRGCQGIFHRLCVKEKLRISNLRKFKCPQHACFLCNQRPNWRCVQCTMASHDKCAAWPDKVIHLKDQHRAVCWRHPADWRLDKKQKEAARDIEEVFCQLPLPYVYEEFNIDSAWRNLENKEEFKIDSARRNLENKEEFKIDSAWRKLENKEEPPPYVHIRRNIYLVKKKRSDFDDDIGCRSCSSGCCENCVCRVQSISCSKACRCSESCKNRPFRKEKKIKIVKTEFCGWGVEAAEPISKGEFVVEYIGEVISDVLCTQRLWDMKYQGVQNFYMCEIGKDFTIDATFKGNTSRFLNHSCDPNCNLEKWQVERETRVGVFAARSIKVGEPLTYDYRFVQFGPEVMCHCGSAMCQGYLGTKRKIDFLKDKKRKIVKLDICWGSKRKRSTAIPVPPNGIAV